MTQMHICLNDICCLYTSAAGTEVSPCAGDCFSGESVLFSMWPSSTTSAETTGLQHSTFTYPISFIFRYCQEPQNFITGKKKDKPSVVNICLSTAAIAGGQKLPWSEAEFETCRKQNVFPFLLMKNTSQMVYDIVTSSTFDLLFSTLFLFKRVKNDKMMWAREETFSQQPLSYFSWLI